jgi:hypothetical protein
LRAPSILNLCFFCKLQGWQPRFQTHGSDGPSPLDIHNNPVRYHGALASTENVARFYQALQWNKGNDEGVVRVLDILHLKYAVRRQGQEQNVYKRADEESATSMSEEVGVNGGNDEGGQIGFDPGQDATASADDDRFPLSQLVQLFGAFASAGLSVQSLKRAIAMVSRCDTGHDDSRVNSEIGSLLERFVLEATVQDTDIAGAASARSGSDPNSHLSTNVTMKSAILGWELVEMLAQSLDRGKCFCAKCEPPADVEDAEISSPARNEGTEDQSLPIPPSKMSGQNSPRVLRAFSLSSSSVSMSEVLPIVCLGGGPPQFFNFGGSGAGLRLSHFDSNVAPIASGFQFMAWFRFEKKMPESRAAVPHSEGGGSSPVRQDSNTTAFATHGHILTLNNHQSQGIDIQVCSREYKMMSVCHYFLIITIDTADGGKPIEVELGNMLEPGQWYHLAVTFTAKSAAQIFRQGVKSVFSGFLSRGAERPVKAKGSADGAAEKNSELFKDPLQVHLNGRLVYEDQHAYPKYIFSQALGRCYVGMNFDGQIGPVRMLSTPLSCEGIKAMANFHLRDAKHSAFLEDCAITRQIGKDTRKMLVSIHPQLHLGDLLIDEKSLDKYAFQMSNTFAWRLGNARHVLEGAGGIRMLLPIAEKYTLCPGVAFLGQHQTSSDVGPLETILSLFGKMIADHRSNQFDMLRCQGVQMLRFLLESIPPKSLRTLTMSSSIVKSLFQFYESAHGNLFLQKAILEHLLFNFPLWCCASPSFQNMIFKMLLQLMQIPRNLLLFHESIGVQRLLDTTWTCYSVEETDMGKCVFPRASSGRGASTIVDQEVVSNADSEDTNSVSGMSPFERPSPVKAMQLKRGISMYELTSPETCHLQASALEIARLSLTERVVVQDVHALIAFTLLCRDDKLVARVLMAMRDLMMQPTPPIGLLNGFGNVLGASPMGGVSYILSAEIMGRKEEVVRVAAMRFLTAYLRREPQQARLQGMVTQAVVSVATNRSLLGGVPIQSTGLSKFASTGGVAVLYRYLTNGLPVTEHTYCALLEMIVQPDETKEADMVRDTRDLFTNSPATDIFKPAFVNIDDEKSTVKNSSALTILLKVLPNLPSSLQNRAFQDLLLMTKYHSQNRALFLKQHEWQPSLFKILSALCNSVATAHTLAPFEIAATERRDSGIASSSPMAVKASKEAALEAGAATASPHGKVQGGENSRISGVVQRNSRVGVEPGTMDVWFDSCTKIYGLILLHALEHVEHGWQQLELMLSLHGITTGGAEVCRLLLSHLLCDMKYAARKEKQCVEWMESNDVFPENFSAMAFMLEALFACDVENKDLEGPREEIYWLSDSPHRILERSNFRNDTALMQSMATGVSLPRTFGGATRKAGHSNCFLAMQLLSLCDGLFYQRGKEGGDGDGSAEEGILRPSVSGKVLLAEVKPFGSPLVVALLRLSMFVIRRIPLHEEGGEPTAMYIEQSELLFKLVSLVAGQSMLPVAGDLSKLLVLVVYFVQGLLLELQNNDGVVVTDFKASPDSANPFDDSESGKDDVPPTSSSLSQGSGQPCTATCSGVLYRILQVLVEQKAAVLTVHLTAKNFAMLENTVKRALGARDLSSSIAMQQLQTSETLLHHDDKINSDAQVTSFSIDRMIDAVK